MYLDGLPVFGATFFFNSKIAVFSGQNEHHQYEVYLYFMLENINAFNLKGKNTRYFRSEIIPIYTELIFRNEKFFPH